MEVISVSDSLGVEGGYLKERKTNLCVEINYDYKVDSKDPTKIKKKQRKAGKGAGNTGAGAEVEEGSEEEQTYDLSGCNYVQDPELFVGFPDEEVEYETTNCL